MEAGGGMELMLLVVTLWIVADDLARDLIEWLKS
jgi:hypothetical protein